ncbi:hypothetical protein AOLI_G00210270 [Acnodon oligacanthus]
MQNSFSVSVDLVTQKASETSWSEWCFPGIRTATAGVQVSVDQLSKSKHCYSTINDAHQATSSAVCTQERKTTNKTNVNNPGLPGEEPAGAHARPPPVRSKLIEVCRRGSSNGEARDLSGRARRVGGARLSSPDGERRREKRRSFTGKQEENTANLRARLRLRVAVPPHHLAAEPQC